MFELAPYNRNRMLSGNLLRDFFGEDFFTGRLSSIKADIYEEGSNLVIEAELPGFNKDEIKVNIKDNQLTISAQRTQSSEEKTETYLRRERSINQVCRTFIIDDLDTEKIEARYENGLLRLTLPKPEQLQPKSREIQIN